MGDNLKQKTINAVKWNAIDRFGQQGLQLIIGIILAHKIGRGEFGLINIIAIFSGLALILVESGFTQALIRKKDANETDYNTVFYFNLMISVVLYSFLFFAAPYIAHFYKEPRLIDISRTIFLIIPINALYLVPFAQLNKEMDFKNIAKTNIIAVFVSGTVGIILALKDLGAWALVVQSLLFQFTRMVIYHYTVRWKPKLIFSFSVIRNFWSFSLNLLGSAMLTVIFNNIYPIILGKYYKIEKAGDYYQANKLSETFNYSFLMILTNSSYPLFIQVQDNLDRFRQIYRSYTQKSSIITFPVMITLIAVAKPLIFVMYSEKFLPAVPIFQLLCSASLFSVLYSLTINALNARGKSKTTFRIELIKKGMILISVFVFFNVGILPMLAGYAFVSFIAYLITILYLKKEIGHYIKHQIQDFISPVMVGIIIAACCYGMSFIIANTYILLGVQFVIAAGIYLFWIKKYHAPIFKEALDYASKTISGILKKR